MMHASTPAEERAMLEQTRIEYLKTLRGRSDSYDAIREAADRLIRATGAPERARSAIEGALIEQMLRDRDEAMRATKSAVDSALVGERCRLRSAIDSLLTPQVRG